MYFIFFQNKYVFKKWNNLEYMVLIVHFYQRHLEYFPMSLNILQKYYFGKTWFKTAALPFITWINRIFHNKSPSLGQSGYFQRYGVINNTEMNILEKNTLLGSLDFFNHASRGGILLGQKSETFQCLLALITFCQAKKPYLSVFLPGGEEQALSPLPSSFENQQGQDWVIWVRYLPQAQNLRGHQKTQYSK